MFMVGLDLVLARNRPWNGRFCCSATSVVNRDGLCGRGLNLKENHAMPAQTDTSFIASIYPTQTVANKKFQGRDEKP